MRTLNQLNRISHGHLMAISLLVIALLDREQVLARGYVNWTAIVLAKGIVASQSRVPVSSASSVFQLTANGVYDRDAVESVIRRHATLFEGSESGRRISGLVFYTQGNYIDAEGALRRALEMGTGEPLSRLWLGDVYHAEGDNRRAVEEWVQVSGPAQWMAFGKRYETLAMWDAAEMAYHLALLSTDLGDSQRVEVYTRLGVILLYQRRDFRAAESFFRAALDITPKSAELHTLLAHVLMHTGETDDAVVELRNSIDIRPTSFAYQLLGEIHLEAGQTQQAIDDFTLSLWLDPVTTPWPRYWLGRAMWVQGRWEDAMNQWESALTIDPNFEPATAALHLAGPNAAPRH